MLKRLPFGKILIFASNGGELLIVDFFRKKVYFTPSIMGGGLLKPLNFKTGYFIENNTVIWIYYFL
jgi:hypothetical protein